MLSALLKEHTSANHLLLEKKLVSSMKSITTIEDYTRLLKLFYSYFAALELPINLYLDPLFLPDYADRRKTEDLVSDLKLLGDLPPALMDESQLPEIKNNLQALGALYVIEGSSLGGKIISRMIRQLLERTEPGGFTFFESYGDDSPAMWEKFKVALDKPLKEAEQVIVIQAANSTFFQFSQWFDLNQPVN